MKVIKKIKNFGDQELEQEIARILYEKERELEYIKQDWSDHPRIAFQVLNQYIGYFIRFKVNQDSANEIINNYSWMYNIDKRRHEDLLNKLVQKSMFDERKFTIRVSQAWFWKTKSRNSRYVSKDLLFVLAIPYIELETDIIKLVFLNKHTHDQVRYEVYKECLIREN